MHRRYPLQLLAARSAVAVAARRRRRRRERPRLSVVGLYRADPQFPPLQLAADVPVRRLAGPGQRLPAWPPAPARRAGRRNPVPALRHQPAHERPGLPEQRPGRPHAVLQQPGQLHRQPAQGGGHALPALRRSRHARGWRVGTAEHQHPADRKRVLLEHSPQARHLHRRAADPGPDLARRAVCGSALPGHQPVPAGGHRPDRGALPRRVPAVLRAGRQPATGQRRMRPVHQQLPDRGQGRPSPGPGTAPQWPADRPEGLGQRADRAYSATGRSARPGARRCRTRQGPGCPAGQGRRRLADPVGPGAGAHDRA
ncbi:hypothetical protein D3C78_1150100 [compost metagenome]